MEFEKVVWHPAGIFQGVFSGYSVSANRHVSERDETAWHTTSYSNSGDFSHREYWVVDGQFRQTLQQTMSLEGELTSHCGDVLTEAPDTERKAILEAIEAWSSGESGRVD